MFLLDDSAFKKTHLQLTLLLRLRKRQERVNPTLGSGSILYSRAGAGTNPEPASKNVCMTSLGSRALSFN